VFPERTWRLEQAEGHPKRLRATIPKNKLGPFSKTQRIARIRELICPKLTVLRELSLRPIDQKRS
jgi:hypothetical protein